MHFLASMISIDLMLRTKEEEPVVSHNWVLAFDAELKRLFAIDHVDAGLSDEDMSRYTDMPPREAAAYFGDKYDLLRADIDWR